MSTRGPTTVLCNISPRNIEMCVVVVVVIVVVVFLACRRTVGL